MGDCGYCANGCEIYAGFTSMLRNGACDAACNVPECHYDDADCLSETNPLLIHVSTNSRAVEMGTYDSPYSSLHKALLDLWAPYTKILLLNGTHNFTYSSGSTSSNPLRKGSGSRILAITIASLFCVNSAHPECASTPATLQLTRDQIRLSVYGKMTVMDLVIRGDFDLLPGCWTPQCVYCPYTTYDSVSQVYRNDRGEIIDLNSVANQTYCSGFNNMPFFDLQSNTALSLLSISVVNVRSQLETFISASCAAVSIRNVNFINFQGRDNERFIDQSPNSVCGSFEYIGGTVSLLNNGYEYQSSLRMGSFARITNASSLIISCVIFSDNVVFATPSGGGNRNNNNNNNSNRAAALLYIGSPNTTVSNCTFLRNIVTSGGILAFQTDYVFPATLDSTNSYFIGRDSDHILLKNLHFELNSANKSVLLISFSADQLNVRVTNCSFINNFAANENVFAVTNVALSQEAMTGVLLDVALSDGSIVSVFSPPRYVIVNNCTFTGNNAVIAMNFTNIGQVKLLGGSLTNSRQSTPGSSNLDAIISAYMQRPMVYMQLIPKLLNPLPCVSPILITGVYNVSVIGVSLDGSYCPNGIAGVSISNGVNVLELGQLSLKNSIGHTALSLIVNASVSLNAVNITNNTDLTLKSVTALSLSCAAMCNFTWMNSTIANNTGGSTVVVANTKNTAFQGVVFTNNTAKENSAGISIAVIPAVNSNISFFQSNFTRNSGNEGGVILITDSSNSMSSSELVSVHLNVTDCRFIQNSGKELGSVVTVSNFVPLSENSTVARCRFSGNNNGEMGAGLHLSFQRGVLTVINCTFNNNTAKRGSALYSNSRSESLVMIMNCTFTNNSGGSVVAVLGSSDLPRLNSQQLLFQSNFAPCMEVTQARWSDSSSLYLLNIATSGVVIKAFSHSIITISDAEASGNFARASAGVLYLTSGSQALFVNSLFTNNTATTVGGVAFIDQSSKLVAKNATFDRNFAIGKGSVVYQLYSEVEMYNVSIMNNEAGMYSCLFLSDSSLYLINSKVSTNKAAGNTPGISAQLSNVTIQNSTFINQMGDSGSMLLVDQSTVKVNSTRFMDCRAVENGGCIYASHSHISIDQCTVENAIAGSGSFLFVTTGSQLNVSNCQFSGLVSIDSEGGMKVISSTLRINNSTFVESMGGALSISNGEVWVNSCTFQSCNSVSGSALYTKNSELVHINSSEFRDNTASYGGAIYCTGDRVKNDQLDIDRSTFANNDAWQGAAIYITSCNTTVQRTEFVGNSARSQAAVAGRGGAVLADCGGVPYCFFVFSDNVFDGNFANVSGGALAWKDSKPDSDHNNFKNNYANYGNDIASHAIIVAPVDMNGNYKEYFNASTTIPIAYFIENFKSGAIFDGIIRLGLFDYQYVLYTVDSSSPAEIIVPSESNLTLFGDIKAIATDGILVFSRFTMTGPPGSQSEFFIHVPALQQTSSDVINTVIVKVSFRECLMGEYQNQNKCDECSIGTYSFHPSTPCNSCPEGAICLGNYTMVPKSGYWRADIYSAVFFPCNNPDACIGSRPFPHLSFQGDCAPGYGGNLCDSCDPQHSKTGKNTCSKCPSFTINLIITGAIVIVALIFMGVVIYIAVRSANRPNSELAIYMKILMNYSQMMIVAASMSMRWPSYTTNFLNAQLMVGNAAEQVFSVDCLIQEVYTEKIFYSRIIVTSLLPIILMGMSLVGWLCIRILKKVAMLSEKLISSFVTILFLLHMTITKIEFSMFACAELKPGELWLAHDMEERCWSSSHFQYILTIAVPSIVVWVLGLPLLCLGAIIKKKLILGNPKFAMQFSFLYRGYIRRHFYWEFVILYRKVCSVIALVFLAPVSPAIQAQTVLAVLLVSCMLQLHVNPFNISIMNSLETKSIVVSMITIYCGLYYESNAIGTMHTDLFSKIMIFVLIVAANAYFVYCWTKLVLPSLFVVLFRAMRKFGRYSMPFLPAFNEVNVSMSLSMSRSSAVGISLSPVRVPDNSENRAEDISRLDAQLSIEGKTL